MSPSYVELGIVPGENVRLTPEATREFRGIDGNANEKYYVEKGPAHGASGNVVLRSKLDDTVITIASTENVLDERAR